MDSWNLWQWPLMPRLTQLTLFMAVLGNGIDIARLTDRSEGVTLSFQVILRLLTTALATLCGCWGWWRLPAVRQALSTGRGGIATAMIGLTFLSAVGGYEPKVAFFVAWAMAFYLLVTLTCLSLLGMRRTLMTAMVALWAYVFISWILRFTVPEIATFHEFLSMDESLPRFGGLGHPNVLSSIQCIAMLLLLAMVREGSIGRWWIVPGAVMVVATLLETKSRTPALALTAVLGIYMLPAWRIRDSYLLAAVAILGASLMALMIEASVGLDRVVDEISIKLTKTGSVDELTSATGRTEIWMRAIELIQQSPWLGYGGGSSSQVMVEHSGHAHNLILEPAVLFGIPVACLFCLLLWVNIREAYAGRIFFVREFTVYLLVLGLAESPLFGLVPDPAMCIWLSCLFAAVVPRANQG